MNGYLSHSRKIITAVDEFDFMERIKPSAVMQYFQDSATVHAEEIGIGFEKMKSENLCWVLNRLSAVIDRMPKLGEEITVTTYPHKPGIAEALRDYYVTDSCGKSLIRGVSRWCVLDLRNKAIRRCAPLFDYPESAYKPEFAVEGGNPQLPDLGSLDCDISGGISGKVNITDLDRNGHMNNARYADITVNCCGYEFYKEREIKSFDFNFLCELKADNQYRADMKTMGNVSYFEANGNARTNPVFRASITWK